jgi:hypothetical protein
MELCTHQTLPAAVPVALPGPDGPAVAGGHRPEGVGSGGGRGEHLERLRHTILWQETVPSPGPAVPGAEGGEEEGAGSGAISSRARPFHSRHFTPAGRALGGGAAGGRHLSGRQGYGCRESAISRPRWPWAAARAACPPSLLGHLATWPPGHRATWPPGLLTT